MDQQNSETDDSFNLHEYELAGDSATDEENENNESGSPFNILSLVETQNVRETQFDDDDDEATTSSPAPAPTPAPMNVDLGVQYWMS